MKPLAVVTTASMEGFRQSMLWLNSSRVNIDSILKRKLQIKNDNFWFVALTVVSPSEDNIRFGAAKTKHPLLKGVGRRF